MAFSPDGTKLYFSDGYRGDFHQLDPGTREISLVAAGRWALPRLAPDGKIYVVRYGSRTMGVVENPDADFVSLVWGPEGVELPEGAREFALNLVRGIDSRFPEWRTPIYHKAAV